MVVAVEAMVAVLVQVMVVAEVGVVMEEAEAPMVPQVQYQPLDLLLRPMTWIATLAAAGKTL